VGVVADLPPDSSPIQITSEGVYGGKPFVVVGRILYEYEQGGWNEWHIVFNDGRSGWLSDAQLEYDVSFIGHPPGTLPVAGSLVCGNKFQWSGMDYEVTSLTRAHYKGVDGELPFEYWDKADVLFADLRTADGHSRTDTSEPSITVTRSRWYSWARRWNSTRCNSKTCVNSRDGDDAGFLGIETCRCVGQRAQLPQLWRRADGPRIRAHAHGRVPPMPVHP
jgi:hypothetical protein